MAAASQLLERPRIVEAEVIYQAPMDHPATFYLGGEQGEVDDVVNDVRIVPIHNVRGEKLSYDIQGFALYSHKTAVMDFRDPAQIQSIYRSELEAFVREVTGAAKVEVWKGGAARLAPRAKDFGAAGTTYPSPTIHGDYTENSAPREIVRLIGEEEARERLKKRYAIFSLWRAFSDPPQDVPLCLCDASTVKDEERRLGDVYYGKGPLEKRMHLQGTGYVYSPAHRWCYLRDMTKGELLFIKTFDSDDTKAWRVPHTSFVDSSAGPNAIPRASLDIRAAVFWDR